MSNRLRKGQFCPLHHSYFCCGREMPAWPKRKPGAQRQNLDVEIIEDVHHPRGFREKCSLAELRRRKDRLILGGMKHCFYCKEELIDYREIELAHIEPKGMGGARHDDHRSNLTLAHKLCNRANGSKRPAA